MALFKKEAYVKKGKYGIKYLLMNKSALDYQVQKNGIYGDWLASIDQGLFSEKSIAMDIGANVGLLTIIMAKRLFPKGKVYAYEPDYQNFGQLSINLELNELDNLQIMPIAIQDNPKKKSIKFNIRRAIDGDGKENRGLSSILPLSLHHTETFEVASSTIDEEVKKLGLKKLDFVKIDVEGAEAMVISGGVDSIKKYKPIILYECSVVLDSILKARNSYKAFKLLDSLGYIQLAIKDEKRLEIVRDASEINSDINILAIHRDKRAILKLLYK